MQIVNLKVGQLVFIIENFDIYEGYITHFINKKEVMVSRQLSHQSKRKTYGVDFFFTREKAIKALTVILEESEEYKKEILNKLVTLSLPNGEGTLLPTNNKVFNCSISFNEHSLYIDTKESSIMIFEFSNLDNDKYAINLNDFKEIVNVLDKINNICYFPNENHRVRIIKSEPNIEVQYIYFDCDKYFFTDAVAIRNHLFYMSEDYTTYYSLDELDMEYNNNYQLLKILKGKNHIYYELPFKSAVQDYYDSILTLRKENRESKYTTTLLEEIMNVVSNQIHTLKKNKFPSNEITEIKKYLYTCLEKLYSRKSINKFKYEVLLEEKYDLVCSAIDEIVNFPDNKLIRDNIKIINSILVSEEYFN